MVQSNLEDIAQFEAQMRRKVHYVIKPEFLWSSIAEMARTQDGELLHTLQKASVTSRTIPLKALSGLFSEINLDSEKLASVTRIAC